jgi:dTDP-4-amino-4,6-dideoxygalactose transaminase
MPVEAAWAASTFWISAVEVNEGLYGNSSRSLMSALARDGIETRPLWQPLHQGPVHAGREAFPCGVATRLSREGLTLPSSVGLTAAQQERVIASVREGAREGRA